MASRAPPRRDRQDSPHTPPTRTPHLTPRQTDVSAEDFGESEKTAFAESLVQALPSVDSPDQVTEIQVVDSAAGRRRRRSLLRVANTPGIKL